MGAIPGFRESPTPVVLPDEDEFWDSQDAKDVFGIDAPDTESAMATQVPGAFKDAGYKITEWGKAETHPVWVLRARRKSAPRFKGGVEFVHHVIQVLRSAGVVAGKSDFTADCKGDGILVAFQWPFPHRRTP